MNEGDLVYIPQGVDMWSSSAVTRTEKPITAVFLEQDVDLCHIYTSGAQFKVPVKFVYPMETAYAS